MKIINPTDRDISCRIKGVSYVVEAKGALSGVPMEHAKHWKEMIHSFIVLQEDDAVETVVAAAEKAVEKTSPMEVTKKPKSKTK